MSDELPQSDQLDGAPHPRDTAQLFGQETAERDFLDAFTSNRLHHAWLITGPRGVGKATLAWQIARFLIAQPSVAADDMFGAPPPPADLATDRDTPLQRRITALSDPSLYLLRRAWDADKKKLRAQITVDDVRGLKGFFAMSSAENSRRVVIIDAAEDMNVSAANALLKVLEEPPRDVVLLLISHQPSRLLPTLRSRCRTLRCMALTPQDITSVLTACDAETMTDPAILSELAGGAPGEALALLNLDGAALYQSLVDLAAQFPNLDRGQAAAFSDKCAARGAEARLDLMYRLADLMIARLCRAALGTLTAEAAKGEFQTFARIAKTAQDARHWAQLSTDITARISHGRGVNLDPALLVLDMLLAMNAMAARTAA